MKKLFIVMVILITACIIPSVNAQTVKPLTTTEFKKQIWDFDANKEWKYKGDKPAIIDMYATWCGPCKRLAPILADIQKDYGTKLQIYKVDTDQETQLSQLFNVSSIPLMIFIPVKGKPFLVTGLRPKDQLVQIIEENLFGKKTETAK